jgi:methanogenic corrinoid protein MtbC1
VIRSEEDLRPIHPIRVAAARAGLTPAVIRAWERRYGAVEPARLDSGRRLYSAREVQRLSLLRRVVERGHLISSVATMTEDQLLEVLEAESGQVPVPVEDEGVGGPLGAAMAAVRSMDPTGLDRALRAGCLELGVVGVLEDVLVPLLTWIGDQWRYESMGPATEHVASGTVRRFLEWLLTTLRGAEDGPVFAVATGQGEPHEFGALMAGVVALTAGRQVVYLGPGLPIEEIARGAVEVGARTLGVSVTLPRDRRIMREEATGLRGLLPASKRLIFGGGASGALTGIEGVETVTTLSEFRRFLEVDRG